MRPSAEEVFLRFAETLAERGTCSRLRVGAVVTDSRMLECWIGYNGNARELPNQCDSDVPGMCGCMHAEFNALLKAPGTLDGKVLFTSVSPCVACAKAALNSFVRRVVYREEYRRTDGLDVLRDAGVQVQRLT